MNWKSILYKGLPVLLIAVTIVIVAVIVSRPDPEPKVTNEDKVVLEFNDTKITKGDLYELLKHSTDVDTMNNTALSTLMNMIELDLLSNELSDYEITEEEVNEKIEEDKDNIGEDIFYEKMILFGIIDSKDDPQMNEKLKSYYKLSILKDVYTRQLATKEVEDDEEGLEDEINDYKEMACAIILKYESKKEADNFTSQLENSNNVEELFKNEWENQQVDEEEDEEDEDEDEEYPDFIVDFECNYDKITYSDLSYNLRNFVYSDDFLDDNNNFKAGNYSQKLISGEGYYYIYILGVPTYDLEDGETNFRESVKFIEYIKENLIDGKLTTTYKTEKIKELREDIDLKIYDTVIGESYKEIYDSEFSIEEKLLKNNKNTIASYKIDDETIYITADNLYEEMIEKYSLFVLMDTINYEALKTITDIRLTKDDEAEINDKIANFKTTYLANYSQIFTWSEYLLYTQGVSNEDDLFNHMAKDILLERYQFGYNDYEGVSKINDDELQEAYDNWFSIKASHIIFQYDPEVDGDEDLARLKADQIINGCTNDGEYRENITEETCYIFYDLFPDEDDESADEEEEEKVPFAGLDETPVSKWSTVFSDLAKEYSTEDGADSSGGNLDFFGPDEMVKGFEDAAKEIASRMEEYPFSYEPVSTVIEREDETIYGIHVIYVTDVTEKPEKPEDISDYEEYLKDLEDDEIDSEDLEEKYGDNLTLYEDYKDFMDAREEELKTEFETDAYKNKILAELRISLTSNIKVHEDKIEKILNNINNFYTLEDEEETE